MTEEKYTCYYPIFYLPPNKYHYNTAQMLSERDQIDSVIVLIPNIKTEHFDAEQCLRLFEIYQKTQTSMDVSIEICDSKNPFAEILRKADKDMASRFLVALDEATARSSRFNSIFSGYDNVQVELIASNFKETSELMTKGLDENNKNSFLEGIPEILSLKDKDECWSLMKPSMKDIAENFVIWQTLILENFGEKEIFDTKTTGMPNYDAMIKSPAYFYFFKNRAIQLKEMTPEQYMKACAKYVHDISLSQEYAQVKKQDVQALEQMVQLGKKIDTPVLNVADKAQEGRHRSVVAKKNGLKTIPVWVITKIKEEDKQKALSAVENASSFNDAKKELERYNIPLDKKTYEKIRWKEFKKQAV